jgi:hypothetical protein
MTDPKVEQLRAARRRENAAERVAYAATMLTEALTLVRVRAKRLEETVQAAARHDVPMREVEAMTKDGLEDLPFPGVQGMIRRAYAELYEVTGADTVMWCVAHRRQVRWIPFPGWWIHVKGSLPLDGLDGTPSDPRGCRGMRNAEEPITITRKDQSA